MNLMRMFISVLLFIILVTSVSCAEVLVSGWWNETDDELLCAKECIKTKNSPFFSGNQAKILQQDWMLNDDEKIESALEQIENELIGRGNHLVATKEENSLDYTDEISVGDTVVFGAWYYEDASGMKRERITWNVIDIDDDTVLLLSNYGQALPYIMETEEKGTVTWKDSIIRAYLNAEVYYQFFNEDEQYCICNVYNKNQNYGGKEAEMTMDRLFLLSYEECERLPINKSQPVTLFTSTELDKDIYYTKWTRTISDDGQTAVTYNEDFDLRKVDEACVFCPAVKLNRKVTKFGKNQEDNFVAMLDKSTEKTIRFLDLEWGASKEDFQECLLQHGFKMKYQSQIDPYGHDYALTSIGYSVYDYSNNKAYRLYGKYEPIDEPVKIASHEINWLHTYEDNYINEVEMEVYYDHVFKSGILAEKNKGDFISIYADLFNKLSEIYGNPKIETIEYTLVTKINIVDAEWIGSNGTGIQLELNTDDLDTSQTVSIQLKYLCFRRSYDKEFEVYSKEYFETKKTEVFKLYEDITGL